MDHDRTVFCVNMASHTVTEIGKRPGWLYRIHRHLCCNTDSSIFCGPDSSPVSCGRSECRLFDLVTLKVTNLPSLQHNVFVISAVAMGSKIFMIGEDHVESWYYRGSTFFWYLDLQDEH